MKEKLLIWNIDDDDISKFVMKRNLRQLSVLNVIDFSGSSEPLEILSSNYNNPELVPDIIFLDLNMPIINGFQFLEDFQKINEKIEKSIQIFMVSSSLNSNDVDRAKSIPEVSDYFVKPIELQDLRLLIENMDKKYNQV
jgi:response regulator RpfG family c-di-GMP phosphodiesterase